MIKLDKTGVTNIAIAIFFCMEIVLNLPIHFLILGHHPFLCCYCQKFPSFIIT